MIDYNMPAERYHADPCPKPSLSASISGILYGKSPLHAWYAHPRLNPSYEAKHADKFDLGTAAHAVLLEGHSDNLVQLDFDDWRTKASKEAKEAVRSTGKTPILKRHMAEVLQMAHAAETFIKGTELRGIFSKGKPEVTLTTEQNGIYMRSRLDLLTDDGAIILDLKTTEGTAKPESFIRGPLRGLHYDLKAEFYKFMVYAETKEVPKFFWLVQETEAPYACSLVGMAPSMIDLGARKFRVAHELWRKCITENRWPAYGDDIHYAESEPWQETTILERELREGITV